MPKAGWNLLYKSNCPIGMIRPNRKRKQLIIKCLAEILTLAVVFASPLCVTRETLTPYFLCLPVPTSNPGTGSKTRIPLSHSWKPMTSKGWSCDRSISQCFWRRKQMLRENKWTTLNRENQDICRAGKKKHGKNIRKHKKYANKTPARFCWSSVRTITCSSAFLLQFYDCLNLDPRRSQTTTPKAVKS